MKKLSVLAIITAIGIAGTSSVPVQAAIVKEDCGQYQGKIYSVSVGQKDCPDQVEDILKEICGNQNSISWKDCPVVVMPGSNSLDCNIILPGSDTSQPENTVQKPETDASQPGNNVQKPVTDVNQSGSGTSQPDSSIEELSFAEQVVKLVNKERAKAGLSALTLDEEITSAALIRANEIETSFSHTRPDGRDFSSVLKDQGISFRGAGENIAWGQKSPEEVMNAWMNSDGHRANILNPNFTKIGVGHRQNSSGRNYWVQLFTY